MKMNLFEPTDILIPKAVEMEKWAVIACDQFTSQPEYWERVEKTVGDNPSTFRIILFFEIDFSGSKAWGRIGRYGFKNQRNNG